MSVYDNIYNKMLAKADELEKARLNSTDFKHKNELSSAETAWRDSAALLAGLEDDPPEPEETKGHVFRITMKDPDGVSTSIEEAARDSLSGLDLSEDELEAVLEKRQERLKEDTDKWFEYGEYLEVEIDTGKGTCTVIPNG